MSLSWRKRIRIELDGAGARFLDPVAGRIDTTTGSEQSAHPAIASLDAWLREFSLCGAAEITLGNDLGRFVVVPWAHEAQAGEERRLLARARLTEHFGQAASTWRIVLDRSPYGKACLAYGIEDAWMTALESACKRHQLRIASLQPRFVRACNAHRAMLKEAEGLVVVVEAQSAVIAIWKNKDWHSIRTLHAGHVALETLITRERILQGLSESAPAYVWSAEGIEPPSSDVCRVLNALPVSGGGQPRAQATEEAGA